MISLNQLNKYEQCILHESVSNTELTHHDLGISNHNRCLEHSTPETLYEVIVSDNNNGFILLLINSLRRALSLLATVFARQAVKLSLGYC